MRTHEKKSGLMIVIEEGSTMFAVFGLYALMYVIFEALLVKPWPYISALVATFTVICLCGVEYERNQE